jgi:hypothetical protein
MTVFWNSPAGTRIQDSQRSDRTPPEQFRSATAQTNLLDGYSLQSTARGFF